jgi:hypothetical protein
MNDSHERIKDWVDDKVEIMKNPKEMLFNTSPETLSTLEKKNGTKSGNYLW